MQGDLLKTKQHFEILDGLRGVAAIMVVIFHFMEVIITNPLENPVGHGFMAVDFFFCLSGFVIAYAYDTRMAQMGLKQFFVSRLIRLHPLVVLGTVLGLIMFICDPFLPLPAAYTPGKLVLLFLAGIFMIPYPVVSERYFNLFNLNAPSWSLFWEYVANIVYGIVLWRVPKRWLIVLLLPAAVCLVSVSFTTGNLLGGWSGDTFWQGGARIAYSFLAGMIVYRFNLVIKNKLGFIGMTVLLLAALLMPGTSWNWLTEALVVMVYFPLLVSLGAGAGLHVRAEKLCGFLGRLSYPLYMTHYAAIFMFANYYNTHQPAQGELTLVVVLGVLGLISVGYLAMVLYDIPVRKYLSGKRK